MHLGGRARGSVDDGERSDGAVTTTWLPGLPAGDTEWDRFAAQCPDQFRALGDLVAAAWDETDPVLLELARVRMATLLGFGAEERRRTRRATAAGLTEAKLAELPRWPRAPHFTARERECIALAEQFVVDANGVTDEQVAAVTEHLGPAGCYAFVQAISVLETFQRACLTLGIEAVPDVDLRTASRGDGSPTQEVSP